MYEKFTSFSKEEKYFISLFLPPSSPSLPLSIPFPPLLLFKKEINIEKNSSFFSSFTKEKGLEKEGGEE
jgi:hypothetical protein